MSHAYTIEVRLFAHSDEGAIMAAKSELKRWEDNHRNHEFGPPTIRIIRND